MISRGHIATKGYYPSGTIDREQIAVFGYWSLLLDRPRYYLSKVLNLVNKSMGIFLIDKTRNIELTDKTRGVNLDF